MYSAACTKIKRHLVCFAVSQQSVCIKSFPVAFLKHRLLRRLWCWTLYLFKRSGRNDVEYLSVKSAFPKSHLGANLNIKQKLYISLWGSAWRFLRETCILLSEMGQMVGIVHTRWVQLTQCVQGCLLQCEKNLWHAFSLFNNKNKHINDKWVWKAARQTKPKWAVEGDGCE